MSVVYFSKDTFDTVSISMAFISEIEAVSLAGVFQRCRTIDEKDGVVDIVFLAELGEERTSENVCSRWFKLCME